MSKTYADSTSAAVEYRGFRIVPRRFERLYRETSGRSHRFMWCVMNPSPVGSTCMHTVTLEGCKAIVKAIHEGRVRF
jgi:hypothetical protein